MRSDCGAENVTIAGIQAVLTKNDQSHVYGTSPSNQRIESYWSLFRRSCAQSWIDIFEDLEEKRVLRLADKRQIEILRFCFMDVLRTHIHEEADQWNTHRIRPSRGAVCPAGRPDELFCLPPDGYIDCGKTVTQDNLQNCNNLVKRYSRCLDKNVEDYLDYICYIKNWSSPNNWQEGLQLYINLNTVVH